MHKGWLHVKFRLFRTETRQPKTQLTKCSSHTVTRCENVVTTCSLSFQNGSVSFVKKMIYFVIKPRLPRTPGLRSTPVHISVGTGLESKRFLAKMLTLDTQIEDIIVAIR